MKTNHRRGFVANRDWFAGRDIQFFVKEENRKIRRQEKTVIQQELDLHYTGDLRVPCDCFNCVSFVGKFLMEEAQEDFYRNFYEDCNNGLVDSVFDYL